MEKKQIMKTETALSVNPETLIQSAIEKGLPIETMKELLLMRTELKKEYAREQFFISLSQFQNDIPAIVKRKKVHDKYGKYRYSFAPLDDIIEQVKTHLMNNFFSYTLKTAQAEKTITVICEAHHASGHTEETLLTVPVASSGFMSGIQEIGSALSFAKRYCFCNAFGIVTGDEDDDAVSNPPEVKTQPAAPVKSNDDKIKEKLLFNMQEIIKLSAQDVTKTNLKTLFDDACKRLKISPIPAWDKLTSQQLKALNADVAEDLIKINAAVSGDAND